MVILAPEEAQRLAARGAPVAQGTDGRLAMLTIPRCLFLTPEHRCAVYAERPDACRVFPQRPMRGCLIWPGGA